MAASDQLCGNKEYPVHPVQTHELVNQGVEVALGDLEKENFGYLYQKTD